MNYFSELWVASFWSYLSFCLQLAQCSPSSLNDFLGWLPVVRPFLGARCSAWLNISMTQRNDYFIIVTKYTYTTYRLFVSPTLSLSLSLAIFYLPSLFQELTLSSFSPPVLCLPLSIPSLSYSVSYNNSTQYVHSNSVHSIIHLHSTVHRVIYLSFLLFICSPPFTLSCFLPFICCQPMLRLYGAAYCAFRVSFFFPPFYTLPHSRFTGRSCQRAHATPCRPSRVERAHSFSTTNSFITRCSARRRSHIPHIGIPSYDIDTETQLQQQPQP